MHDSENEGSETRRRQGRYANYFEIGHNAFEFVLDIGQLYRSDAAPRFHTRVVVGPVYAKALLGVLGEAVTAYESEHRAIDVTEATLSAEDDMSASKEAAPASDLSGLLERLKQAIEQLKQSISKEEDALADHTRELAEAAEMVNVSQQALEEKGQINDGYSQALARFDAAVSGVRESIDAAREVVDCMLDAATTKEIQEVVAGYDRATGQLQDKLDAALSAQQKASASVESAKSAWQTAKAELEALKEYIAARSAAFDAWRTSVTALAAEIAGIDLRVTPARAMFLLMSVDRLLAMREEVRSSAELAAELDAKWVRLIRSRQDVAASELALAESDARVAEAQAAQEEHRAKRDETLLAKMAEIDSRPPPQSRQQAKQSA